MIEMTAAPAATVSVPDAMYAWGLDVIRAFQGSGNPAITGVALFFSALGNPITYIAIVAFMYWCVDEKRGAKLGIVTFLSYGINTAIKGALRVPRPFVQDPSVGLAFEPSYSTPSAHAQVAAAFWPTLAFDSTTPKTQSTPRGGMKLALAVAGWTAAILLPVLIGLSRVYLGVHYPTDVLLGWAPRLRHFGFRRSLLASLQQRDLLARSRQFRRRFDPRPCPLERTLAPLLQARPRRFRRLTYQRSKRSGQLDGRRPFRLRGGLHFPDRRIRENRQARKPSRNVLGDLRLDNKKRSPISDRARVF